MGDLVIAGGGFTGLGAALFLARRGHAVTLVERDGPPPPRTGTAEDDDGWHRPGAPQSHQSHVLLGRARRVLFEETPDVLDELVARGVRERPIGPGEAVLHSRRLVAEAVLRRAVEEEPGVTVRSDEAVTGVTTRVGGGVPVVTGVTTSSGETLRADLVVDAGGRRSALPAWLADADVRPVPEQSQACGFFYLTRYYRVRPGCDYPPLRNPPGRPLGYATLLCFDGDNDTFSLTMALSVDDPHRQAIRDPERHHRFLAAAPHTASWVEAGEPISDITMMAKIENRRRRLVDDDGPVVGGVVSVGDAALHTNPTLGRGISIGLWHAQHLADVADVAADDPVGFVGAFDQWTQDNLAIWFDTQVAIDAGNLADMAAALRGEPPVPTEDPTARFVAAAFALGATDAVVGDAMAKLFHLLASPLEVLGDPDVAEHVAAYLATNPDLAPPPPDPDRVTFEAIATG